MHRCIEERRLATDSIEEEHPIEGEELSARLDPLVGRPVQLLRDKSERHSRFPPLRPSPRESSPPESPPELFMFPPAPPIAGSMFWSWGLALLDR